MLPPALPGLRLAHCGWPVRPVDLAWLADAMEDQGGKIRCSGLPVPHQGWVAETTVALEGSGASVVAAAAPTRPV